jgi:sigma-54 dependent transcriptional regulator, acetoin dehydrogenase operon transcriptional activator AcoR
METRVLDPEEMRREIEASHVRSLEYGVCKEERNPEQVCLTLDELDERRRRNKEFLDVACAHIDEFSYHLTSGEFMMAVVDSDGYILCMVGSDAILTTFARRNCAPGFRWTERDVGTSAISLCLERRIPVQINDKDHYCRRAHGFTSSAAPVFSSGDALLGVLVVSGSASLVHPHTLIMIVAAARSVEEKLRIMRRNRELANNIGLLNSIIESVAPGLMVMDKNLNIVRINQRGKRILGVRNTGDLPADMRENLRLDLNQIRKNPGAWLHRECRMSCQGRDIHFIYNAQPVISPEQDTLGAVLTFEESETIRKLADDIAGTMAFYTFDHLIGTSHSFLNAVDLAKRAAQTSVTVLLRGETGTGKELFAQAIHNGGKRRRNAFVAINCSAIPGELLESELFGYVEGAFTGAKKGGRPGKFALAHGGTLLLDEIGDMPHNMQAKLLRVLQTGEVCRIGARKPMVVDTRVIACTHVNLTKAVEKGRFREDLFYRLNVFPIAIPPLRERGGEDIEMLAGFFLKKCSVSPPRLTAAAVDALREHSWPGNVRELENTIQRALHLYEHDALDAMHLGLSAPSEARRPCRTGTLEEMEREMIQSTLQQCNGNMASTAKMLGISRATLYRKVKQFGL